MTPEQLAEIDIKQLQAQHTALVTALTELANTFREWASAHYCQTYNRGRGEGLELAAMAIEEILEEHHEGIQAA